MRNEKVFILDGLDFVFFINGNIVYQKSFKEMILNSSCGNLKNVEQINIIKLTKVLNLISHQKLKCDYSSKINNFFISGLCKLNKNPTPPNPQIYEFLCLVSIFVPDDLISMDSISDEHKNIKEKTKIKIINSVPFIYEIAYGPFTNGPLITGHSNGQIMLWNIYDLSLIKTIKVFQEEISIKHILNEPLGLTICISENKIVSTNLIDKKFEYYYNENEQNELERVVRVTSSLNNKN